MRNPKNGIQAMINAINAKARPTVVTHTPGPAARHPRPPAGGPYRAYCVPHWEGERLTIGSVLYLTMTLREDGTLEPKYDIIVRFDIRDADDQSHVKLMLAQQGIEYPEWIGTYELSPEEYRLRVTIRDEPSSPSGVAVSSMEWVEEPGATPAQLAVLKAV